MGKIKGSKGCLSGLFVVLICGLLGCGGDTEKGQSDGAQNKNNHAASQEENREAAVNTLLSGQNKRNPIALEELKAAVVEILGDNYWPDAMFSQEELAEKVGISADMYDSFLAEYQHSEAGIDMMIIIEAKDGEVTGVEEILNEYRELLLKSYEDQPQNKAKVFASRIETIENHICYVQLGADISGLSEAGEDAMVAHCQQENERAVDMIEKTILER
ncbi:MAG: DUF4358 domain-containing protein [Lachnospiraceae bacterium]|nr:DUF4358 domain-containing protein [Lachnospiraceae bacterium]